MRMAELYLMGGRTLNDRTIGLLSHYEMEVLRTRKGRGSILCETKTGLYTFREYGGPIEKIDLQNRLLTHLKEQEFEQTEQIVATKEGELFVKDTDGTCYVLKSFFEGRECTVTDTEDCIGGVRFLAKLHSHMCIPDFEGLAEMPIISLQKEYDKHNRELRRVRKYLREKSQKNAFELYLQREYDFFWEKAMEIAAQVAEFYQPQDEQYVRQEGMFCHGDFQHHNLIWMQDGSYAINFEKCVLDDQVRDLYLFMRKVLEKNGWSLELGKRMLDAYQEIRPLSARSYISLYYRLAYPEKFWKIANFYINSGKAWIPDKNAEKLTGILEQENAKTMFLEETFSISM